MALNYLYKMTSTIIKTLQEHCSLAFIPLGPTEVHGPHLPLMTDICSGLELAERAAAKLQAKGIESVIATPVTYCAADVTNVFTGNTSLRLETVEMIFEDICISLARNGFTNIVVVSGHADPGNAAAVVRGIENAKKINAKIKGVYSDWFNKGIVEGGAAKYFNGENPTFDLHAGESETGFMMMRYPELLDREQISKLEPNYEGEFLFERIANGAKDFIECGAPNAYFGDPAAAKVETADKQYDVFSDYIVEEIFELLKM